MTLSRGNNSIFFFSGIFLSAIMIIFLTGEPAFAQQPDAALERRVAALENYVATFQPTLVEVSNDLNGSIQQYTRGLESSLEDYSQKLQINLDERLRGINRKTVIMNPFSKEYQIIETNTGILLIAIEKVEPIDNGVRLHFNIGNPNFADYQDFTLKLFWGRKRGGGFGLSYDQWRQSLKGAEFTFQGKIEKGKWNAVTVDLTPVGEGQLGHLECEMSILSVMLGYN